MHLRTAFAVLAFSILFQLKAQDKPTSNETPSPLVLTGTIPLPNIRGRIDHLGFDPKGRLFVSALGNNAEEVIDLAAATPEHSITGIPKPQGVVYARDVNKLFVGSDEGKLYIYDAESFSLITTIDFGDDVDNLRYDPSTKQVYVGFGDADAGAIGIVNATTNQRLPQEFKLGAHPESFQLASSSSKIYVNLPDSKQIAMIDRSTETVSRWPVPFDSNFPMALDEAGHRLFVATRSPARLLVFDSISGRKVAALPCVQNSDDLFFDVVRKRIYVVGGEGYISVFQQNDPDHYEQLARIPSALGARTAGYFGKGKKGFDFFYVAVPARADASAEILVYTVQD